MTVGSSANQVLDMAKLLLRAVANCLGMCDDEHTIDLIA